MDHRAGWTFAAGVGITYRRVIVGELQVAPLTRIERRTVVRKLLLAVHPRLHEAIVARGPLNVVDELVPDVLPDRADRRRVFAVVDILPAVAAEHQRTVREVDVEI